MPETVTTWILLMTGLVAGLAGGMLGIGGSLVMIPALTEALGPNQHLYQAAAMIVNFFVAAPAVYQHRRAKAIDPVSVVRLLPLAAFGVLCGVGLSELPIFAGRDEAYLRGLFGLFLLGVCVFESLRSGRGRFNVGAAIDGSGGMASAPALAWGRAACVAIPVGVVAGLLGVGGGVLAVPLQRHFLRVSIRTAIANSATVIVATSVIGATAKNYALFDSPADGRRALVLAALLAPPAMLGSLLGSRLTHRIPVRPIKLLFSAVLLVAALRLVYGAVADLAG